MECPVFEGEEESGRKIGEERKVQRGQSEVLKI